MLILEHNFGLADLMTFRTNWDRDHTHNVFNSHEFTIAEQVSQSYIDFSRRHKNIWLKGEVFIT